MTELERFRTKLNQARLNERSYTDMSASENSFKGAVRVNGAGESTIDVTFPKLFTEKPHLIGFSGEVLTGDAVRDGFMPTVSVIILGWITEERPPTSRFYRGAKLGIVTTGTVHQKLIVYYAFSGTAVENPV